MAQAEVSLLSGTPTAPDSKAAAPPLSGGIVSRIIQAAVLIGSPIWRKEQPFTMYIVDYTPKAALLVTPHPDDAEGGCGGTLARWIKEGAKGYYVLCTNGDKGSEDPEMTFEQLAAIREREQQEAADVMGVSEVTFLRIPDGTLEDNHEMRKGVVRAIRKYRPDVVMCIDPWRSKSHTHRDHRMSGLVALEAIAPYACNPHYYPELLRDEGLQPHLVKEAYLWGSEDPDAYVEIGETLRKKFDSLSMHASQFQGREGRWERLQNWAREAGAPAGLEFAERFRRIQVETDSWLARCSPGSQADNG